LNPIPDLFFVCYFLKQTSAPSSEQGRPEPPTPAAVPAKAEVKEVKPKEDAQEAGEPAGNTAPTNAAAATGDDAVRTEHLFKHPLMNVWTLWYLENDRSKSWEDMQNEITSFDTVEDFWSLYNHIKPPSEIKVGSDYSLFKKNIRWVFICVSNKINLINCDFLNEVPCGRMLLTSRAVAGSSH